MQRNTNNAIALDADVALDTPEAPIAPKAPRAPRKPKVVVPEAPSFNPACLVVKNDGAGGLFGDDEGDFCSVCLLAFEPRRNGGCQLGGERTLRSVHAASICGSLAFLDCVSSALVNWLVLRSK